MLPHGGAKIEASRDKDIKKNEAASPAMEKSLFGGADLSLVPEVANDPHRVKRMP